MIRLLLSTLLIVTGFSLSAQSSKAVQWSFTSKKVADQTYEVHMTAKINSSWHIYSQNGGDGPISTTFNFTKNPLLSTDGKIKEVGSLKKAYQEVFNSEVRFYEKTVNFIQKVKVRGKAKTNLAGKVEFMACDETRCLPPSEVNFTVNLGG